MKDCCIPVADHLELHQVVACSRNGSSPEILSGNLIYAAVILTVPCLRLRCWLQLVSITDRGMLLGCRSTRPAMHPASCDGCRQLSR